MENTGFFLASIDLNTKQELVFAFLIGFIVNRLYYVKQRLIFTISLFKTKNSIQYFYQLFIEILTKAINRK